MTIEQILRLLPFNLDWMVAFRLAGIQPLVDDATIRAMYYLPEGFDLAPYSHVVLTSVGRMLAPLEGSGLLLVAPVGVTAGPVVQECLYERFADTLNLFPPDEADCLGFGTKANLPPALLHLTIHDGYGDAKAVFRREPTGEHYELLRAVGVEYRGGEQRDGYFVARFRNNLPTHFNAGALAHFSRTGNCNRFFLNHGEIDTELESGLLKASHDRTKAGLVRTMAATALLARATVREPLAMTCQPPPPAPSFAFGDLVPAAFLLRALNRTIEGKLSATRASLRDWLQHSRQDGLWAFHTGRLITATDSALVLSSMADRESVELLERFADGTGGYYPQLWSDEKQSGHMQRTQDFEHWCQADFATTCLARSLRARAGLTEVTPLHYLEERFPNRAGLYFANPYLVDWALAESLRYDSSASSLKARLLEELLASRNSDFSFGTFDLALSTSAAIMAMAALGFRGRTMRMAQLRLLGMVDSTGRMPACIPFYSSERSKFRYAVRPQVFEIEGAIYELSWYHDSHHAVGTALAAEALDEECTPENRDIRPLGAAHPRYRCGDHTEYVSKFALPAYVGELAAVCS